MEFFRHSTLFRRDDLTLLRDWRTLLVIPAAGLCGGAVFYGRDESPEDIAWALLWAPVILFIAWALGRELRGGRLLWTSIGAFAALGVWLWWPVGSLWIALAALLQLRLVNGGDTRRAGVGDSLVVLLVSLYAMTLTEHPFLWFSLALAFAFDASAAADRKRQWLFAALAMVGGLTYDMLNMPLLRELAFFTLPEWSAGLLAVGGLHLGAMVRPPDPARQRRRGATLVALLIAATPLFGGNYGLRMVIPLWVVLAAGALLPRR